MGEFPRKSDGRRVFTVEFKRGVVQQLLKGEKTLAEVSREPWRRTRRSGCGAQRTTACWRQRAVNSRHLYPAEYGRHRVPKRDVKEPENDRDLKR